MVGMSCLRRSSSRASKRLLTDQAHVANSIPAGRIRHLMQSPMTPRTACPRAPSAVRFPEPIIPQESTRLSFACRFAMLASSKPFDCNSSNALALSTPARTLVSLTWRAKLGRKHCGAARAMSRSRPSPRSLVPWMTASSPRWFQRAQTTCLQAKARVRLRRARWFRGRRRPSPDPPPSAILRQASRFGRGFLL